MKTTEKSKLFGKYTSGFHPFFWSLGTLIPEPVQIGSQGPQAWDKPKF